MVSLKDVLSHHSSDDDLYITRSHMKWQAEGRRYTEAAVERVLEVMHHDFLTADRGDGKGRVRASMLNDPCLRKQQLSFIGERAAPPPRTLQSIFDIGTFAHYRWQLAGLSAGWLTDIEVPVMTEYGAGGALDGVTSRNEPFEFKTANSATYRKVLKHGPLAGHILQVHPYMQARGFTQARIMYEDKSWDGSFSEFVVKFDQETADKVQQMCEMVTGDEQLPPVSACVTRSGELFRGCAFTEACRPWEWSS